MDHPGEPPGWYPDPWAPGVLRWWDGQAWTPHHVPVQATDPRREMASCRDAARRARALLPVGGICYAVQLVALGVLLASMDFGELFDPSGLGSGPEPGRIGGAFAFYTVVANLGQVGVLVVGVLFLVWFHKAASVSALLGVPARRSPGWAVAGFLIPIVNFWFPYQSATDMVAPGHRAAIAIARWWTLWIVLTLSSFAILLSALISGTAAIVASVVAAGVAALATAAARMAIEQITEAQEELLAARS